MRNTQSVFPIFPIRHIFTAKKADPQQESAFSYSVSLINDTFSITLMFSIHPLLLVAIHFSYLLIPLHNHSGIQRLCAKSDGIHARQMVVQNLLLVRNPVFIIAKLFKCQCTFY